MQAAVALSQASFLSRPLRRLPRLYHTGGVEDCVAGRGGASLPWLRVRRALYYTSISVGAGSSGSEHIPVFARHKTGDPYKLLGVDNDASEEEISSARNFLLQQYAGYEESEEAIEGAYDKIIMKSYSHRKHSKINLKSKLKKQVEESPSWVKTLLGHFEVPSMDVVSRRFALFAFIAGWSIATSVETGPTFQVNKNTAAMKRWRRLGDFIGDLSIILNKRKISSQNQELVMSSRYFSRGLRIGAINTYTLALSIISCMYFLNDKMKNLAKASTTGLGVFVAGWIVGSLLVPVIPAFILPPAWPLELLTSLVAYVFMFLGCTFLK